MQTLDLVDPPIDLRALERKIRGSSNFNFASAFYAYDGANPCSPRGARAVLEAVIVTPDLHRFLRDTFVKDYRTAFTIEPLEKHAIFVPAAGRFENVLASASLDQAGAYSRSVRDATEPEMAEISALFGSIGDYQSFELVTEQAEACPTCGYASHLFSMWFYGTAWDWCFLVAWPKRTLVALICLTDTD